MARASRNVTKRVVDALAPGATVWDAALRGFAARRQQGTVSFILKTRTRAGRQTLVTIGRHGSPWTVETARAEARRLLEAIRRDGLDPVEAKRANRHSLTLDQLFARVITDVQTRRKPRTAQDYRELYERHIKRCFGRLKLNEITRTGIAAWHVGLHASPVTGNRSLAVLRRLLNLARKWGLHEGENPATLIERFPERARDRIASADELRSVGKAISELGIPDSVQRCIVLCAVTGARQGEVRGLRWEDVDTSARTAKLRDTKNGSDRLVALGALALSVLEPIHASGWLCPALRDPRQPLPEGTLHAYWRRITVRAEVKGLTLHDLRHGLATQAARDGASALLIRDLLGHKTLAMANRYVASERDEALAAQRTAGASIGAALAGATPTAEVIGLHERQGRDVPILPIRETIGETLEREAHAATVAVLCYPTSKPARQSARKRKHTALRPERHDRRTPEELRQRIADGTRRLEIDELSALLAAEGHPTAPLLASIARGGSVLSGRSPCARPPDRTAIDAETERAEPAVILAAHVVAWMLQVGAAHPERVTLMGALKAFPTRRPGWKATSIERLRHIWSEIEPAAPIALAHVISLDWRIGEIDLLILADLIALDLLRIDAARRRKALFHEDTFWRPPDHVVRLGRVHAVVNVDPKIAGAVESGDIDPVTAMFVGPDWLSTIAN